MQEQKNFPKPRSRKGPWIFKITEDFTYQSNIKERSFDSEWLKITPDGKITVKGSNKNGYAWDGCTPKFNILDLWVIGTPDARIDVKTGKPKTFYASLIHDALYQYLDVVPLSKKESDNIFKEMLKDFILGNIYYWFVSIFGGKKSKKKS